MQYITLNPSDLQPAQIHRLILGIIVPRPIGLISTMSPDGTPNLAPFSYFQAVSANPPAVIYCPNRSGDNKIKHSLRYAKETGEFVASVVTEEMTEAMNFASGEFADGVSEFVEAGFTPLASEIVKPFRVAESPVNLECKVLHIIELGDKPLSGNIVVGEVVRIHIHQSVFDHEKKVINPENYHLISRLGGIAYGRISDTFDMPRPKMTSDGKVVSGSHLKVHDSRAEKK